MLKGIGQVNVFFIGGEMKKNRNARKALIELYFYFDYSGNFKEKLEYQKIKNKYEKKFKNGYGREYYGLFKTKNGRIAIDPKRFKQKIGLNDKQYQIMSIRNTTYFHPTKKSYNDYYVNLFVDEINSIKKDFIRLYKPIIDKSIQNIKKMKTIYPGDYSKFTMGISGAGAANAWAQYQNYINERRLSDQKVELFNSLYAQFFHIMASRIEALTVSFYTKKNPKTKLKKINRNVLYDNKNEKSLSSRNLHSFQYHDRLYSIWNFIKHNNLRTYKSVKEKYPEVLIDKEYQSGYLAIHYVKLNEKLILELLEGVKNFFIEWCELNLNEDYGQSLWNYDDWFKEQVDNEIEAIQNPLGLTIFDEID